MSLPPGIRPGFANTLLFSSTGRKVINTHGGHSGPVGFSFFGAHFLRTRYQNTIHGMQLYRNSGVRHFQRRTDLRTAAFGYRTANLLQKNICKSFFRTFLVFFLKNICLLPFSFSIIKHLLIICGSFYARLFFFVFFCFGGGGEEKKHYFNYLVANAGW